MDGKDWKAVDRQIARRRQSIRDVLIRDCSAKEQPPQVTLQAPPPNEDRAQPRTLSPL